MEAAGLWTPRPRPQVPWKTGSARFPQLPQGILLFYRVRPDLTRQPVHEIGTRSLWTSDLSGQSKQHVI